MKRSKLRNKYLRERANKAKSLRNKQRNLSVNSLCETERDYFRNLNNKIVTDYRKFWKTVSPVCSKRAFHRECIILKESNKTIINNEELPEQKSLIYFRVKSYPIST